MQDVPLAIYVYAFTSSHLSQLPLVKIDEENQRTPLLGVDDEHPLSFYQYEGLNAIISSVSLQDFIGETGELNVQNIAWLTPRACRHALVIDQLTLQSPVYPLSFGTLFSNLDALQQEMAQRSVEILHFLKLIDGCDEWSLEATLDQKKAVDYLFEQGLKDGRFLLPEGAGRRHLEEQKIRRFLTSDMSTWLESCLAKLDNDLLPLIRESRSRRLLDNKVLHEAYLVPVEHVQVFKDIVSLIESHYQVYGLNFRLTGPWAAYSFCQSKTQ